MRHALGQTLRHLANIVDPGGKPFRCVHLRNGWNHGTMTGTTLTTTVDDLSATVFYRPYYKPRDKP